MMITNGLAARIVTFCRLSRASSPPESSSATAMRPVIRPHSTVIFLSATSLPFWLMVPITVDAESAEVMKKVDSRIIAMIEVSPPSGRSCSRLNSMFSPVPSP